MTKLDDRIREDLENLLKGKRICRAVNLNKKLSQKVSEKGEPSHFCGDRDAFTVMVMLNPGCDATEADERFSKISKSWKRDDWNDESIDKFIEDYKSYKTNYADYWPECYRYDAFDVKQAAFLKSWPDSGIDLPKDFDCIQNKLLAKRNVLLKKLQLELVPFASQSFKVKTEELDLLVPYFEDCLDEIFSRERKYVILCGQIFESLLRKMKEEGKLEIEFEDPKKCDNTDKVNKRCIVVHLKYDGVWRKLLIAHTFASQGLTNAYKSMEKYGLFCYKEFKKSLIKEG